MRAHGGEGDRSAVWRLVLASSADGLRPGSAESRVPIDRRSRPAPRQIRGVLCMW